MRTKILLTIAIAFFVFKGYGQNWYDSTQIIDLGNGVKYNCDTEYGGVTLYNSSNKWTNVEWNNADGTTPALDVLKGDVRTYEITLAQHEKLRAAVNDAFTPEQKRQFGDYKLGIKTYIDPHTGNITEVQFEFFYSTPFGSIQPQVYRNIELELKSDDIGKFTVTDAGRKLNYLILSWNQSFQ